MVERVDGTPEPGGFHMRPDTAWLHAFFELEEGLLNSRYRTITPLMEAIMRRNVSAPNGSEPASGDRIAREP